MESAAVFEFAARVSDLRRRRDVDEAMAEVLDAFAAAEVQSLLLKGPVLAQVLYWAQEHRGYRDIDVLVGPSEFPGARAALARLGYRNVSEQQGVVDVGAVVHHEVWLRSRHGAPLVTIDLHWRLAGWEAGEEVVWAALQRSRLSLDIVGRSVSVPDRSGLALHVATHAVQHGGKGVKAMADLKRAIDRWPSEVWRSAAILAAEVGATPALSAGLRLLPAGSAMADELDLPAIDVRTWSILHRESRPRGAFHLEALAGADSVGALLHVLRHALFPTRAWIAWEYRWADASRLRLLAAYGRHLMRAPAWAVGAWRFRRRARRAVRSDG